MNAIRPVAVGLIAVSLLITAGCQAGGAGMPTEISPFPTLSGSFAPYYTITPSRTATQPSHTPPTATPLPSETPTPRTHMVKAGEDMSGIALRYRVPLSELKTANPAVNPRLMKIGTILLIPGTAPAAGVGSPPSVTPRPIEISTADCTIDKQGGAWCFFMVQNRSGVPMINVTLQLRLLDELGKQISHQQISLPLDLLAAGAAMPLGAYFQPSLPVDFQIATQLVSALPASAAAERYSAGKVSGVRIEFAENRRLAEVEGDIELAAGLPEASQVSVLAIAYDETGRVVGLRRWDSDKPLKAGQRLPFQVSVYSTGGFIQRVEVLAEGRR